MKLLIYISRASKIQQKQKLPQVEFKLCYDFEVTGLKGQKKEYFEFHIIIIINKFVHRTRTRYMAPSQNWTCSNLLIN